MKERNKWCIFSLILITILFLTGCAGLGDWTIELGSGYAIDRVNGHQKILTRKRNEGSSHEIVIDNLYAQKYLVHGNIICVGGLETHSVRGITDEELQNGSTIYYIINVEDDSVIGPFDLDAVYRILEEEADFTEEPSFTILPGKG